MMGNRPRLRAALVVMALVVSASASACGRDRAAASGVVASPFPRAVLAAERAVHAPPRWQDSFESADFRGWGWHGQGDPTWGHIAVGRPGTWGVPPLDGRRVARFEITPGDVAAGRFHAKLYEVSAVGSGRSERPPADVSGTYSAWYYLPANYRVPGSSWVNVFQFKEKYRAPDGEERSDPLWWVQLGRLAWARRQAAALRVAPPAGIRPDRPVAFLNRWRNRWTAPRRFLTLPLGRWFELKAVVRQRRSITFSLDGRVLDVAHASEYPVSPFHGRDSREWIWGVGNYSTGANGPLYVDAATISPP